MNLFVKQVLLGTAVGDSLGLPTEGLSRQRIQKKCPHPLCQNLIFGKGMISDDTEHTVFVLQSLLQHSDDVKKFQKALAWKLRWWLLCLPAGIGFATLRSIIKLWIGFSPEKSGVFSAGNGPAMRSAIIGIFFAHDLEKIREYVKASTRLTHTDPKAEIAALAIAWTAAWASQQGESTPNFQEVFDLWWSAGSDDPEWLRLMGLLAKDLGEDKSIDDFAKTLGLEKGVSGYAYHTVPIALYAWMKHFGDYRKAVESVIRCGGDTDTVGAITGALAGINSEIPEDWIQNIRDYPLSLKFLNRVGEKLDRRELGKKESFPWILLPIRNLFFLVIVLFHGFRRLLS